MSETGGNGQWGALWDVSPTVEAALGHTIKPSAGDAHLSLHPPAPITESGSPYGLVLQQEGPQGPPDAPSLLFPPPASPLE